MTRRFPMTVIAGFLVLLALAGCRADPPPARSARVDPASMVYTFFPVTLLQAFVNISDDEAARISAIDAKFQAAFPAAADGDEKHALRKRASDAVRAVLSPDEVDRLADCALQLQIFTNTFGRANVQRLRLTADQMPKVRPIMADAVVKYLQIQQERDQAMDALPPTASAADMDRVQQERERKIEVLRAGVRAAVEPLLTAAQKAALAGAG